MGNADSEEIVLYARSGESLEKVRLHKFAIRPEILYRSDRHFVWDEARQHYREASILTAAPKQYDPDPRGMKHLPLYNRSGQPVGSIAAPGLGEPPDILHCGLWQFVWKKDVGQYHEALAVRVAG